MKTRPMTRPPRIRIDLNRTLSTRWRYAIALAIVVMVGLSAWWAGRDRPVPEWISGGLVPALGWIYLLLAAGVVARWLRRRGKGSRTDDTGRR